MTNTILRQFLWLMVLAVGSSAALAVPGQLTLEEFLQQVMKQNDAFKGSALGAQAGLLRTSDAALLYSPTVFGSYSITNDKLPQSPLFPPYKEYHLTQTQLGVKAQTPVGLNAQFTYNLSATQYVGLYPEYADARPTLEVSQSLFRNFFGSEIRANHQVIEASAKASSYSSEFSSKNVLVEAENAYWRLVFARKTLDVQKGSFDRAQAVYDWSAKRTRVQLADQSDLYQADASLRLHRLYLQQAQDDFRSAAHEFNAARGLGGDQIAEVTEDADDAFKKLSLTAQKGTRLDVKAAYEQTRASEANAKVGGEKFKPDFTAFGNYSWGARKGSQSDAMSNAWTNDNRGFVYGLRFTAPIDFFSGRDSSKGWSAELEAADLNYQRKIFEQDRDWGDLVSRKNEVLQRLELAKAIEQVQSEKAKLERSRLKQGRSTTFLVSTYEQDYSTAQLTTLQLKLDLISISTKMKLFDGGAL